MKATVPSAISTQEKNIYTEYKAVCKFFFKH